MHSMFLHATRLARARRLPNLGSSLLNPKSHRARVRRMMAIHNAQNEHFEQQALSANIAGSAHTWDSSDNHTSRATPVQRRSQRKRHHIHYLGSQLAERVKAMSDSEWEAVGMAEKHAFVKYMAQLLKEHPTQATEQQRRRYFETTMTDPRSLNSAHTVTDSYERMKLGLPFAIQHPQRNLGVSQALYNAVDASLFDPSKVHQLENAMIQVKQVFTDYVTNKRQGRATEAQRRQLAHMTAELNLETQRHLASTFRHAEERVRVLARQEKERQMRELMRLRALVRSRRQRPSTNFDSTTDKWKYTTSLAAQNNSPPQSMGPSFSQTVSEEHALDPSDYLAKSNATREDARSTEQGSSGGSSVAEQQKDARVVIQKSTNTHRNHSDDQNSNDTSTQNASVQKSDNDSFAAIQAEFDRYKKDSARSRGVARLTRYERRARLRDFLSKAMGVDVDVAMSLLDELEAQEQFMQFCEVFARLTQGTGFVHRASDEGLNAYTESIRKLYGADAQQLSTLDVVQYLAAKDNTPAVEWARRWYERALLIPLTRTPEYQRLQAIQEEERRALILSHESTKEDASGMHNPSQSTTSSAATSSAQHNVSADAPTQQMKYAPTQTAHDHNVDKDHNISNTDNHSGSSSIKDVSDVVTVSDVGKSSARATQSKVINLVEKMFVRPDDVRIKTLQEKRLRYMAYLQMERQISQARQNARRYLGVENTPEAEHCRALYTQLLARKRQLKSETRTDPTKTQGEDEQCIQQSQLTREEKHDIANSMKRTHDTVSAQKADIDTKNVPSGLDSEVNNIFDDPVAAELFERIRDIVIKVQRTYTSTESIKHHDKSTHTTQSTRPYSEEEDTISQENDKGHFTTTAQAKAAKVARVLKSVKSGEAVVHKLQAMLEEKKHRLSQRLLAVVEQDVRSELTWLDALQEAERPPLLPIPEPASYISAADVQAWRELREDDDKAQANPFHKEKKRNFKARLYGQSWRIPDSPMLFWGTGTQAIQQALKHAEEDAERRRLGVPLAPPYPCPENPWGWRLVKDILDD